MEALSSFETDIVPTSAGDLHITSLGHGSLVFYFEDMYIYVDPYSHVADYSKLPKADIILLTHQHHDHLDLQALEPIKTVKTDLVLTETCSEQVPGKYVLRNGEDCTVRGIHITAVPAYNIVHTRVNGKPFHPKGAGNGYLLTFGDKRVYVAGDTENTPEMKSLTGIDIAFLPMNLPYTMTPEMVADAALAIRPKILYPYHYGSTDTGLLKDLLAEHPEIEVRIRKLA